MKRYFKDFYGGKAVINVRRDGTATLVVYTSQGVCTKRGTYTGYRGARAAMGRLSDCWQEKTLEEYASMRDWI